MNKNHFFGTALLLSLSLAAFNSCTKNEPEPTPVPPNPVTERDTTNLVINSFSELDYALRNNITNAIKKDVVIINLGDNWVVTDTAAQYPLLRSLKQMDADHPKDETKTSGWIEPVNYGSFRIIPSGILTVEQKLMLLNTRNSLGSTKTTHFGAGSTPWQALESELTSLNNIDGAGTYVKYTGEQVQVNDTLKITSMTIAKGAPAYIRSHANEYNRIVPVVYNFETDGDGVDSLDYALNHMPEQGYNMQIPAPAEQKGKAEPANAKTDAHVTSLRGLNNAGVLAVQDVNSTKMFNIPTEEVDLTYGLPGYYTTNILDPNSPRVNNPLIPDSLNMPIGEVLSSTLQTIVQTGPSTKQYILINTHTPTEAYIVGVDEWFMDPNNVSMPSFSNSNARILSNTDLVLGKQTQLSSTNYNPVTGLKDLNISCNNGDFSFNKLWRSKQLVNDETVAIMPGNDNFTVSISIATEKAVPLSFLLNEAGPAIAFRGPPAKMELKNMTVFVDQEYMDMYNSSGEDFLFQFYSIILNNCTVAIPNAWGYPDDPDLQMFSEDDIILNQVMQSAPHRVRR